MDIATALRALLDAPGIDSTCQMHGETFRNIATAALAAHDVAVSAGGWYVGQKAMGEYPIFRNWEGPTTCVAVCGDEARAARIVACVNACQGIADPSRLVAALRPEPCFD